MSKPEPGTGPLTFLVQSERPTADACDDCRHCNIASTNQWCLAFGGRNCSTVRAHQLAAKHLRCPAFSPHEPKPEPTRTQAPTRRPGWLRRLLNWIWVMPMVLASAGGCAKDENGCLHGSAPAIVRCHGTRTPADEPQGLRDECVRHWHDNPAIRTTRYTLPVHHCSVEWLP